MALRQLIISKKIEQKRTELAAAIEATKEFITREMELETAIDEAKTEEENAMVEGEVEKFSQEKEENDKKQKELEAEIADLEKELETENSKVTKPAAGQKEEERERGIRVMKRNSILGEMAVERREAFIGDGNVKGFLERVRGLKGQTRAVTGAELTIPDVVLELLRDNLHRYSKLIAHVNLRPVGGTARQNILGTIPEAVWTEMVAKINELSFGLNQIEVDGYKVAGYIAIPNSTLEDSDLNLAAEILDMLGQAIGIAVDKAVIYGKGTKMPLGFITRLAQTSKPADWNDKAREWKDLHATNIVKCNLNALEGAKFFAALILQLGIAKSNFSDGKKVWCMNSITKTTIMSKAVAFNAAGALVAAMNDEMPIIGGKIIEFDFMQDGDIVGGYLSLYLLAERKGGKFAVSEHVMFLDDQTVYKGTARYDGKPVIEEGFMAVNFMDKNPVTSVSFIEDKANKPASEGE